MPIRTLLGICLIAAGSAPSALAAPAHEFSTPSAITSAEGLIGRRVETRDGEDLGRVQDLAIDLPSGRVGYVLIAVGSFLIEDSLIAVEPAALRETADTDGTLVLEADAAALRTARRFGGDDWPLRAEVRASADQPRRDTAAGADEGNADAADGPAAPSARGSAVISDGTRTATLSDGERSIRKAKPEDVRSTRAEAPDASTAQ
jgi:hypothetical protein